MTYDPVESVFYTIDDQKCIVKISPYGHYEDSNNYCINTSGCLEGIDWDAKNNTLIFITGPSPTL